jgi:hypothetical protein
MFGKGYQSSCLPFSSCLQRVLRVCLVTVASRQAVEDCVCINTQSPKTIIPEQQVTTP